MVITKSIVIAFTNPLMMFSVLVLVACLLQRLQKKGYRLLYRIAFIYIFLTSQPYFADLLLYPLEHTITVSELKSEAIDAEFIVVPACYYFTEGQMTEISRWPPCALQRLVGASEVSRAFNIPTLVTGGYFLNDKNISYAEKAASFLVSLGVSKDNIITIPEGTTTVSEVEAIKSFISNKDVVLVTSATHIERASAVLSKYSTSVLTFPVEYHSNGRLMPYLSTPSITALHKVQQAFYAYGAQVKYYFTH